MLPQVARCAWLAAAVLPRGIASDFFLLAVNARMQAGLHQHQQQQEKQHQQQQEKDLSLSFIADALHPFSHESLKQSMPFLRDPALLSLIHKQLAAAPGKTCASRSSSRSSTSCSRCCCWVYMFSDTPQEVLIRLLHAYSGIPGKGAANTLLQLLLLRLVFCISSSH